MRSKLVAGFAALCMAQGAAWGDVLWTDNCMALPSGGTIMPVPWVTSTDAVITEEDVPAVTGGEDSTNKFFYRTIKDHEYRLEGIEEGIRNGAKQRQYTEGEQERKISGMQGAINRLFARVEKLERRK